MTTAFGAGGTMRAVLALARHLAETREVVIISLRRNVDEAFFEIPDNVRVRVVDDTRPGVSHPLLHRWLRRLPSLLMHPQDAGGKSYNCWTDLALLRMVRRSKGCVLITTRPAFNVFAARFAPSTTVTVAQEHMNLSSLRADLQAEIRRTYKDLDAVQVLTTADRSAYAPFLDATRTVLRKIPNALPPGIPGVPQVDRDPVILAAGRLVPQKGFDLLISAFAPVAAAHPAWHLKIFGDGSRRAELLSQMSSLGLTGRVSISPPTTRIGEEMSRASLFVLSSRYEGFGLVLIEAMSKGAAVISFDCPQGPSEIITQGHDGLLVPPQDVALLSRRMSELIADPHLRRELGAHASITARRYEASHVWREWDQLLSDAERSTGHAP